MSGGHPGARSRGVTSRDLAHSAPGSSPAAGRRQQQLRGSDKTSAAVRHRRGGMAARLVGAQCSPGRGTTGTRVWHARRPPAFKATCIVAGATRCSLVPPAEMGQCTLKNLCVSRSYIPVPTGNASYPAAVRHGRNAVGWFVWPSIRRRKRIGSVGRPDCFFE